MRKLLLLVLLAACAKKTENPPASEKRELGPISIEAKSGSSLDGTVAMKEMEGGVQVDVSVENAPPGKHAVHVHEIGDCSAEDAKSAGEHFNPTGHQHGLPGAEQTHLGDLGNMDVGEDGKGKLTFLAKGANLEQANELSFRGRALVVHEKEDTGAQPSGDAGSRIGCAVLGG
jgi:Cu-Zn family superoxide dismutase